ncbi:MAG: hypothetical protein IPI67_26270 [Myxococcales bacterium]|nr:hypothetical protein [Myxococcales bacterium]
MNRTTFRFIAPLIPLAALGAVACNKDKNAGGSAETPSTATPAASGAPAAAASQDLRPEDPGALCSAGERKVWAKWANRRTGITPVQMGDKLALGVAVGNKPRVLVLDKQGKGELINVAIADGSDLAKDIPKNEGKRDLQRVTPFKGADGKVSAYADYRDKYENKRRRIACELVQNKQVVLAYDAKPLIDSDAKKSDKKEPAKEAAKPAESAAPVAVAPPSTSTDPTRLSAGKALRALSRLKQPGLRGDPTAAGGVAKAEPDKPAGAPAPEAGKAEADKGEKKPALREIRDCRTFVDKDGDVWGLGSELHGEPESDDTVKWSMRLFVQPNASGGYYMLDKVPLPKEPKDLHTWEAPTAAERSDGSILLAARYRGTLVSFILSSEHKPTGKVKSYRGGWPGMVELAPDGSNLLLLTSFKVSGDTYELRIGKIGDGLPTNLDKAVFDGMDASLSEPSFALAGSQRWLSVHSGKRRDARLMVLPVDANMKAVGKPFEVTTGSGGVVESSLFAIDGGKLMAVYIQGTKDGDELVSQELTCNVKS